MRWFTPQFYTDSLQRLLNISYNSLPWLLNTPDLIKDISNRVGFAHRLVSIPFYLNGVIVEPTQNNLGWPLTCFFNFVINKVKSCLVYKLKSEVIKLFIYWLRLIACKMADLGFPLLFWFLGIYF